MIFNPITINNVTFRNRILRSSIGGRTCYYNGEVNDAWRHFERRFAEAEVGGIVSATITVDDRRWSPLEYPKLSHDKFIKPLQRGIRAVQERGCRYIIQLGDPGYHTQTSLFSQPTDQMSASRGFDLVFGYRSFRSMLRTEEIERIVENFAHAARRARDTGCDGIEVTASKGYLIHQFLNPLTNLRQDAYGGSVEKRFRFLHDIVVAVRKEIGDEFLFGVRLSARDYNYLPLNLRWPPVWPPRHFWFGNGIKETLIYARALKELGVDYLHISNGFGFINPRENPGELPVDEMRMFCNATRHLSRKAALRATMLNLTPRFLLRWLWGIGWKYRPAVNLNDAELFRRKVAMPVIANGGFQKRSQIEGALERGCDMVSMARPLLANPDLVTVFKAGGEEPDNPCTFCNRCTVATTLLPLGCYDATRFRSTEEMESQIIEWTGIPDSNDDSCQAVSN